MVLRRIVTMLGRMLMKRGLKRLARPAAAKKMVVNPAPATNAHRAATKRARQQAQTSRRNMR